jgi:two-component system response regulator CpxR
MGADDYVPKPFNPRELIARIRAILRRTSRTEASAGPLIAGDIRIDPAVREAWLEDAPLNLTSAEFTLLEVFMREPGHILSRERLTEEVLGRKLGPFDRVIDVHVSNLRKKLGVPQGGQQIKTVRGSGYLFASRPNSKGANHA